MERASTYKKGPSIARPAETRELETRMNLRPAILILTLSSLILAGNVSAATINGTVTAAGGAPLGAMTVAVYGSNGLEVGSAMSNAQGAYSLSLPAGTYRVLAFDPMGVYATNFYNGASSFETSLELTLASVTSVTVNFVMVRAGRVTGTVRAASTDEPLANMTVAAYNDDGSRRGLVTTGTGGGYTLILPPGNYRLVAYDDSAEFAVQFFRSKNDFESADIVSVTSGGTVGAVDFRLPRSARASGTVVDALSGSPIGGITVSAYDSFGRVLASTTTSTQGTFTFPVPPVPFRLVAFDSAGIYASTFLGGANSFEGSGVISLAPEQHLSGLQFAMTKGGRIEGSARDTAGAPLGGITITAWNLDGSVRGFTTTAADGRYSLLLPPGSFRVSAQDDLLRFAGRFFDSDGGFEQGHPLPVISQTTTAGINFVLEVAGRMSGTAYRASDGAPIAGIVLTAWDLAGRAVSTTVSRADGTFILAVAPGSYRLVAHDPGLQYATTFYGGVKAFELSQPITVAAGQQASNLLMPMAAAGILSGRISNSTDGALIADAVIYVYDSAGTEVAITRSDRDGKFTLPLPGGTYRIAASDEEGRFKTVFYNGAATFATALGIRVNASQETTVNFVVDPSGSRRRRPARIP